MQVDAILIPAATPTASIAARPPLSASFSSTLASSISSSVSEHSRNQSAAAETNPNVDLKVGTESGANIGFKFGAVTAPSRVAGSSPSLNVSNLNSKPVAKDDAKWAANSATVSDTTPLIPTSSKSDSSVTAILLAGALLAAHFEKWGSSVAAPNLANPLSDQQPLAQQLTRNPASVTALPPIVAPPVPISQPVAVPAQAVTPGRPILSSVVNAPSTEDQPGHATVSNSTAPATVSLAATIGATTLPALDSNETMAIVFPANFGAVHAPTNFSIPPEASPKLSELPAVPGQASSGAARSFPQIPTQPSNAPTQLSTPPALDSPTPTISASASLTPVSPQLVSPASALLTSAQADSATPAIAVSPAATPVDSRLHALTTDDVTIFSLDQSRPEQ